VIHRDAALLAVDKPVGVSCQAADPSRPDDLVHRLRGWLRARGESDYLGVHQRLDRETSGVVLYATHKAANPGLARQFEGRTVEKRYVAVVEGDPLRGRAERGLRHGLRKGRQGRMVVTRPGERGSKEARSTLRLLERSGRRCLVDVSIETGRTHQIRAQLAAEGAPVVGDGLYGGPPGPRLALHARRLRLRHPLQDGELVLEAPPPSLFEELLADAHDPYADLDGLLARAAERRWGLAHRAATDGATTTYRLLHDLADGAPELAIDVYDRWLVLQSSGDRGRAAEAAAIEAAMRLGAAGIYVKRRPRQANTVESESEEVAPAHPLAGEAAPSPLLVKEGGLSFEVRLGEGLGTGLFLDQRDNRARVRGAADGRRVLNLFCYTAPFTVAAAAGGARLTVSVDASRRLLERGAINLSRNGFSARFADGLPADEAGHVLWAKDAFEALDALAAAGRRFDLVLCDPPTYSTTRGPRRKTRRWKSGSGWIDLAAACFRVLAPGGALLASTNDRRTTAARFRGYVQDGARRAGVALRQTKDLPLPLDVRPAPGVAPHLKALWVETATSRGSSSSSVLDGDG
jgi:23S rRNA (cytosine1962-C5)-methyltransferase